jgi:predicted HTH transcriptional regulator
LNVDDLDSGVIEKTFDRVGQKITEQKLLSLGVLVPYGNRLAPSNGGVILFGLEDVREQYFPDARVSCALFRGENKAHFLDRIESYGERIEVFPPISVIQTQRRLD